MDNDEMRLEEYKELRNEIRLYLSERNSIKKFAYLLVIALLSALFQFKGISEFQKFLLLFLSSSFILILWYQENRRIKAIFRTAAYIQVRIEPKMKGLNWETDSSMLHPRGSVITFFERMFSSLDYLLMYLILIVYAGIILFSLNNLCYLKYVFFFIILLSCFLLYNTIFLLSRGKKEIVEIWEGLN